MARTPDRPDAVSAATARAVADVVVRHLETQEEYAECVRVQAEVWGSGFAELVPAAMLRVAQKVGGVAAGAFAPGGRMLGFVFGLTGVRDGRLVHWSDMLAVRDEARGRGLGQRLKHFQKATVRALGAETMLWTYDPLAARNAHLNLTVLGARVTEYVRDMYGTETGSALHAGIGTDRFVVAWDLTGAHSGPPPPAALPADAPVANAALPDAPVVRVAVPDDLEGLLAGAPDDARRWREETRRAFVFYLARGYAVVGFGRGPDAGRAYYWLARP